MFGIILQSLVLSFAAHGVAPSSYICDTVKTERTRQLPTYKLHLTHERLSENGKTFKLTVNRTDMIAMAPVLDTTVQIVKSPVKRATAYANAERKFLLLIDKTPNPATRIFGARYEVPGRDGIAFACRVAVKPL